MGVRANKSSRRRTKEGNLKMRTIIVGAFALVASVSAAQAAGQWDDALQWENTNVSFPANPFFSYTSPATSLTIDVDGVACGAGNAVPTFTSNGVPFVGATPSGLNWGPSNCRTAGVVRIDINQFARQGDLTAL